MKLQNRTGEDLGVDEADTDTVGIKLLQVNSVTGTDGLQDRLHEDCGSLGTTYVDSHLRNEVDQTALEQILVLVEILVEIQLEPGPAPALDGGVRAEELIPVPAEIKIQYSSFTIRGEIKQTKVTEKFNF